MNAQVPVKIKSQRSDSQNAPGEVRIAYPYFHEKRTKNAAGALFLKKDGTPNPRFSGAFMFPKLSKDPFQCANYLFLWGLAVEAARKMWPHNVDAQGHWVWPEGAQYAVQDGDVSFKSKPKPGVMPKTPEQIAAANSWRIGYWIIEAENFLDPGPQIGKVINGVVAALPARVINGVAQYKGGDFGIPNIHAYAYQNETFGVNFGFDGFCFTREGEPIGNTTGPKPVDQMFAGVAAMVPATAPGGAPMPPLPPVSSPPIAPTAPSATAGPAPMPTASAAPPRPVSVGGPPPLPPIPR